MATTRACRASLSAVSEVRCGNRRHAARMSGWTQRDRRSLAKTASLTRLSRSHTTRVGHRTTPDSRNAAAHREVRPGSGGPAPSTWWTQPERCSISPTPAAAAVSASTAPRWAMTARPSPPARRTRLGDLVFGQVHVQLDGVHPGRRQLLHRPGHLAGAQVSPSDARPVDRLPVQYRSAAQDPRARGRVGGGAGPAFQYPVEPVAVSRTVVTPAARKPGSIQSARCTWQSIRPAAACIRPISSRPFPPVSPQPDARRRSALPLRGRRRTPRAARRPRPHPGRAPTRRVPVRRRLPYRLST